MKEIRQKLEKKSKDWLVDQLVELSIADEANADRIMQCLVAEDEDDVECVTKFKRQIDEAMSVIFDHGPGTWKSQLPTTGFDSVAETLAVVMPAKAKAVIEIAEYALFKLDSAFELQDECELEYLVDVFRSLHLEACYRSKPDPVALGLRLAELGRETEWGFFDGPPAGYSEILGKEGISAFRSAPKVSC